VITPEQRARRRERIQASDVAAILGLSPFANPIDVYNSKVLPIQPDKLTRWMELGNYLEPPLVKFAADRLRVEVNTNPDDLSWVEDTVTGGMFGANLDALIVGRPEHIEAKKVGPHYAKEWGDPGTDAIPVYVQVQCQAQMFAAGTERVWVPAAIASGDIEFRMYRVERDQHMIDTFVPFCIDWWNRHVAAGVPPDGTPLDFDFYATIARVPGKTVSIDPKLWTDLQDLKAKIAELQGLERVAKDALRAAMGDAELADFGDPKKVIAYREQRSAPATDFDRMRIDGVFDRYCTQGKHRALRLINRPKV